MENKTSSSHGLGLTALVSQGVGQAIGAGIVTTVGVAVAAAGRGTWLPMATSVLLNLVWILPLIFFSSFARYKGGIYTMVTACLGKYMGAVYAFWWMPLFVANAVVGAGAGMYINSIAPAIPARVASIVIITFFFAVNLMGVDVMSKVQKPMFYILVGGLFALIIVGLFRLQPGSLALASPGYIKNGTTGFYVAAVLLLFSGGMENVANFSWDAANPKRDIPRGLIISSLLVLLIYSGLAFVDANVMPLEQVENQPLTVLSNFLFPGVLALLFNLLGPLMALLTTMNSGLVFLSQPVLGSIENNWLPEGLAKRNRHGAPWIIYTILFIIGVVPQILDISLESLLAFTVMTSRFCGLLVCIAGYTIPKKFKSAWEKSHLHMPDPIYYTIITIAVVTQLFAMYIAASNLPLTIFLGNLALVVFFAVYAWLRYKTGKTNNDAHWVIEEEADT